MTPTEFMAYATPLVVLIASLLSNHYSKQRNLATVEEVKVVKETAVVIHAIVNGKSLAANQLIASLTAQVDALTAENARLRLAAKDDAQPVA